jgi:molybdate transport system regulatory protein
MAMAMAMGWRRGRRPRLSLQGSLRVEFGGSLLGDPGRMALLRAVDEHGSITQAAKAFGISYKTAWESIDAMNALSGTPLVERVVGGRGGGSTRLTVQGRRLSERYALIDAVHQRFLGLLDASAMDLDQDFSLLQVINMKTSARNQWVGTVTAVRSGAVNDEIEVGLAGDARLTAIVTRESTQALGLRTQLSVIALVKASSVMLATDLGDAKISARNQLRGTVTGATPGAVNAEVVIAAGGGVDVVAIVAQTAIADLGLAPGVPVTAIVKASDVILAVVG